MVRRGCIDRLADLFDGQYLLSDFLQDFN